MAKKSRRSRKPMAPPPIARPAAPAPPPSEVRPQVAPPPYSPGLRPSARPASRLADAREEYKYVVGDLKRIGLLAALIFSALIILSFFLR